MDTAQAASYLSRGGDVVAEILGRILVAIDDDDLDSVDLDAARTAILQWHRLRAEVFPR